MRTQIAFRTLCLLGLLAGCGPKQGEQPAPSPQPQSQPTGAAEAGAAEVGAAEAGAAEAGAAEAGAAEAGAAGECAVDADCVRASCCHPTSCVPVAQKPDCADVACTMECKAGTMDCGGRCACEAGSCKAIIAQP